MKILFFLILTSFYCFCACAQDTIPNNLLKYMLKDKYEVMEIATKNNLDFSDAGFQDSLYTMTFFKTNDSSDLVIIKFTFTKFNNQCSLIQLFNTGDIQKKYLLQKEFLEKHNYKKPGSLWKLGNIRVWMSFDSMDSGKKLLITSFAFFPD